MSFNTQGLGGIKKQKDVLHYLKGKKFDIYCLQDTHFTSNQENSIRNYWQNECYFSPAPQSNARGVTILFGGQFEYKIHNHIQDPNGNYLILDMTAYSKRFSLINIYGPNKDEPAFYEELFKSIEEMGNTSYIICGDFNLTLDPNLDSFNYKHVNNPKARKFVMNLINENNLFDPFRDLHPTLKRYTWRRKNPLKQARLDLFLVTESIINSVKKSYIETGYKSDHSIITLTLALDNFEHGKSLWKHNNSLLTDAEYLKAINSKILDVKKQYCLPIYNLDNMDKIPNSELQFSINDQLFLDTLLMEIRGKSISYASYKKKSKNQQENNLIQNIQKLEENLNEASIPQLDKLKTELYNLREEKMQGVLIRSRANIIDNGEKPTEYFCNLESHNYTSKTINILEKENGEIITNQNDILKEIGTYYENLYTSKDQNLNDIELETYLMNADIPRLDEKEALQLEGSLTLAEASQTLKNMKNNKSPGTSGFSADFFKVFWGQLGDFVVRAVNYGLVHGELSITQQQGLIVCIPKENKSRLLLKNWRPITLLNIVYKIASGSIANRIKKVLDKLISKDQTGFISGRFIGENIRSVYDIMQFTEEQNIPGLLLLIDFEKAFDSLSWSYINKVLTYFNFGPSIRQWIKVFYKNSSSAVLQCGFLSNFFKLGRGCRQGDPISPYIFILCAEILAVRIRNNKNIKGIKIENEAIKISQYADDTSIMLDGSKTSLEEALNELAGFADISGLKINYDKTQVVWIGAKKYSTDSIKTRWKLAWGASQFKLLGITFNVDLSTMVTLNFADKILQLKSSVKQWNRRCLTPLGKITVIKSMLLPKITHLLLSLPNPDTNSMQEINNIFYDFLWHGRTKIKHSVVVKQYFEGGLKMINFKSFVDALKITWIRRIVQNKCNWQLVLKSKLSIQKLLCCGSDYIRNFLPALKNEFWEDVFKALLKFEYLIDVDLDKNNLQHTPIFYNKYLTVDGRSFWYNTWFQKGVHYVMDLLDVQGNFYDFEVFVERTAIRTNFLQYQGVIKSIKNIIKTNNVDMKSNTQGPIIPILIHSIGQQKKGSQNIYDILNKNKETPTGKDRWNKIYNIDEKTWETIFLTPFQITKCTKLRWFQTSINHKILETNNFLHKIKLVDSPGCTFCGNVEETIPHLFWQCTRTQRFLHELKIKFEAINIKLKLNERDFILGIYPKGTSDILQFLMLIAKYHIYICRCTKKQLNFKLYKINVQSLYQCHKEIAMNNNEMQKFIQDWRPFQQMIT